MSVDWMQHAWPLAGLLGAAALFRIRRATAWRVAAAALVVLILADRVAAMAGTTSLAPLPALFAAVLAFTLLVSTAPGGGSRAGSRSSVRHALEASPLPSALADSEGRVSWANDAWRREHGDDGTGAAGRSDDRPWQELLASPEAEVRWQDLYAKAEVHGSARGVLERWGPNDGTWTASALLIKIQPPEGQREAAWFLSLDPVGEGTFRRRTRKAGHDLNNLLSAVVGNVGLALDAPDLPPQIARDLREVETASMRAAELIAQLQAMSRGDS